MDQEHKSESVEACERGSGADGSRVTGHESQPAPSAHIVDVLAPLLRAEPVLCCQLLEALQTGRWLVIAIAKVRDAPPDDLLSGSTHKDFPVEDLVDAMQGQCRALLADHQGRVRALEGQAADKRRWT